MKTDQSPKDYTRELIKTPFWRLLPRTFKDILPGSSYVLGCAVLIGMVAVFALIAQDITDEQARLVYVIAAIAFAILMYLPKVLKILVAKLQETRVGRGVYTVVIALLIIAAALFFIREYQGRKAFNEKYGQNSVPSVISTPTEEPVETAETPPAAPSPENTVEVVEESAPIELRCTTIGWPDAPVAQCTYNDGGEEVVLSNPCELVGDRWQCSYPSP